MSLIVFDSSVAIKWFVVEPYTAQARLILGEYQKGTLTFAAPDLVNAEFGNIVWKKQTFQGLAASDAQQIINAFRRLSFIFTSSEVLLDDAYRLAVAHQRTVYDMLYVALSVQEKCPFVTADEKLVNAISSTFSNVIWLSKWK
jgi:predicted nucleic acid-binding protein